MSDLQGALFEEAWTPFQLHPIPVLPQADVETSPPRPLGRGGSTAAGVWCDGVFLPGAVKVSHVTPLDTIRLAEDSERRGVLADGLSSRRVKRSKVEAAQLQAFCTWLSTYNLSILGTVSFRDDYAAAHGVYSLSRALAIVCQELRRVPMAGSKRVGFAGRYVLSGEWHPSGRAVPHVHLALEARGESVASASSCLWRYFFHTCGRSRFEPMRDATEATLYGLKDTVKASEKDPECIRLQLRPKRLRRR